MRIRFSKLLSFSILFLNLFAVFCLWLYFSHRIDSVSKSSENANKIAPKKHLSLDDIIQKNVTVIIRAFEHFENDVPNTVRSITTSYPEISILVVSDTLPYPPLLLNSSNLFLKNVKHVRLNPGLNNSFMSRNPVYHVNSNYVLFMPDSSRILTKHTLERMLLYLKDNEGIVSVPFKASKPASCLTVSISIKEWLLHFEETSHDVCNYVSGKHASMVGTDVLKKLSDPFMLPFPESFFIQAASEGIDTHLLKDVPLGNGKDLYNNPQHQRILHQLDKERTRSMFKNLGIKKVVKESGDIEWYGCARDTPRCFSHVVDYMPQYLVEGKWTPPCCLSGLRRTARHVFDSLEQAQARHWLHGKSLLGALRKSDILPWDFDVSIGMYKDDVNKCVWMLKAKTKPIVDKQGFLWEKASEGDFYRVHYSRVNKLHVVIFLYQIWNGTMVRKPKKKVEFPENFLKPLSSIDFVGRTVSAPNNIHDFLEHVLGDAAFENIVDHSFK